MRIDSAGVWRLIHYWAGRDGSVSRAMSAVIDLCESSFPHPDWATLRVLPYDEELSLLERWVREALESHPPPLPLRALWFGLGNYADEEGRITADLSLAGGTEYDADDPAAEWLSEQSWRPRRKESFSGVLESIYRLAYSGSTDELGNDAEWPLCLAYAVFAVSRVLGGVGPAAFGGGPVGVGIGFTSGDFVTGELRADGLHLAHTAEW